MADKEILSLSIDPGDSAAKAQELKKQLDDLGRQSDELAKSFRAGAMGLDEHIGRQDALAKKIAATTDAYNRQIAAVQRAATQVASVSTTMDGAAPSSAPGRGASALKQGGRIVQDLTQGGVGAIANNLIEIAPALGVAALVIDGISRNADEIADKLKGWADAVRDTNAELSRGLTIGESFVRNFSFEASGNFFSDFANKIAAGKGLYEAFTTASAGEGAATASDEKQAKAGRDALRGILGQEQKDRIKSLRQTIEDAGGGGAGGEFDQALFGDMGKEARAEMQRKLNKALTEGDADSFGAIQAQLRKTNPLFAAQLDRNMPEFQEEAKQQQKKLDQLKKNEEDAARAREKQAKDDLKAANDRAKDTNDLLDKEEKEAKQKMQAKGRDALDEMDGLRGNASLTYARYLMNGSTPDAAANDIASQIQLELEKRGVDSDTAREQAGDYARGVRRDVGNRIATAGMMAEREAISKPQVFGLADANRLAQEAGPKVQEEQRDLLKIAVERLAGIERNSLGGAVVGP